MFENFRWLSTHSLQPYQKFDDDTWGTEFLSLCCTVVARKIAIISSPMAGHLFVIILA